ncbi:MAG: internalization-related competence protein ComEC/Rec2 protein [Candidatus Giovannonibacteria bacterium GW2011_GWC2_44_8]|uniref:Internalization-related competence protein ComEC/Rec2 protein n=1 Tax=Candidatus Giovannonibacteria bacterium GW2011_GWC2_44_8 TaxID=1618657 RepID=A0A0G1K5V6_9BACT|nr:MAG: internalization-related competence protein ComEC/Rec2 protein [Candidatus Giovannonibacteria bacterium GW2011_GWC2_44_8]
MKRNFKYIFVLILLAVAVISWREAFGRDRDKLKFYMLDVGQGDAIFIETPSGNQILFDGGQDRKILEELGKVMPFYDRSIDLVILTHPHLDHAGGLLEVLKNYEVGELMDGGDNYNLAEYGELKKLMEEKKIKYEVARRGLKISLDKGISLLVLAPDKLIKSDNPHDNNVVSRLSYGRIDFLLMGDGEKGEELKLVQADDNLESEVLKVGHHGSKTSSNPLFLEEVNPEYALISVGAKNRYGHPAQITLDNLLAAGAKILRTDIDSIIEFKTDGDSLTLVGEK